MPARTRGRSKRRKNSPRVIKGRINLKVKGYPGVQKLAPSHLLPFVPIGKLRIAALHHLRKTRKPTKGKNKRGRKGKKRGRKGKKRGRKGKKRGRKRGKK
jgi:hypothetical protein